MQIFEHFLVFDHLRQSRQLPPTASHALSPPPVSCSNRPRALRLAVGLSNIFDIPWKWDKQTGAGAVTYSVTIFAARFPSQSNTFRTSHDVTAAFPIVQCWLWRPPAFHCSYIQPGGEGGNYKPHVYFPTFLAQSLWHILTCLCNINSRLTAHFPLKCFEMGRTVSLHFQPLQIIEEKTFLPKTPNKTFGQFLSHFMRLSIESKHFACNVLPWPCDRLARPGLLIELCQRHLSCYRNEKNDFLFRKESAFLSVLSFLTSLFSSWSISNDL